jgi:ketosteroid isomerase-like protein
LPATPWEAREFQAFEGREAIRGLVEDWLGAYQDVEIEIEDVLDMGSGVGLVTACLEGRLADSTARMRVRYGAVYTWAHGLIARIASYADIDEARAAAERLAEERGYAMPENVEIVKVLMDAVNRRDIDTYAGVTTSDFEWFPVFAARVEQDVYRGREGIEKFLGEVDETWAEFRPMPEEYRDLGDRVLALGRLKTRGRASGAPVESPWAGIYDMRRGKVSRIRTYLDHGEALRAAGLKD